MLWRWAGEWQARQAKGEARRVAGRQAGRQRQVAGMVAVRREGRYAAGSGGSRVRQETTARRKPYE